VVANLAARADHPITFGQFLRYGLPVTFLSLVIATGYVFIRYLA
jgi:Na+/H+ antiporter NhaD/arsenite permease-like protein